MSGMIPAPINQITIVKGKFVMLPLMKYDSYGRIPLFLPLGVGTRGGWKRYSARPILILTNQVSIAEHYFVVCPEYTQGNS